MGYYFLNLPVKHKQWGHADAGLNVVCVCERCLSQICWHRSSVLELYVLLADQRLAKVEYVKLWFVVVCDAFDKVDRPLILNTRQSALLCRRRTALRRSCLILEMLLATFLRQLHLGRLKPGSRWNAGLKKIHIPLYSADQLVLRKAEQA
ncbi:hypothetical protein D917_02071 [Trichinella nativa]|uniref:Uncharacterized protein n=1 Tax=Trichinella nativa TaxID=6335 RepID=A0A1Y3EIV2_9BILA|nr:hypothetical protein D917_02071 [Trichinella nativa]